MCVIVKQYISCRQLENGITYRCINKRIVSLVLIRYIASIWNIYKKRFQLGKKISDPFKFTKGLIQGLVHAVYHHLFKYIKSRKL